MRTVIEAIRFNAKDDQITQSVYSYAILKTADHHIGLASKMFTFCGLDNHDSQGISTIYDCLCQGAYSPLGQTQLLGQCLVKDI